MRISLEKLLISDTIVNKRLEEDHSFEESEVQ